MKFARKCPKCRSAVQTKSIRKSFGLGFVEIPVAQFCLNPACDWYQDFSEAKMPEDIKEDVLQIKKPEFSRKHVIALGGVFAIIIVVFILSYLIPVTHFPPYEAQPQQTEAPGTDTHAANTSQVSDTGSAQIPAQSVTAEQKEHSIKIDVPHGFVPVGRALNRSDIGFIIINRSDTVKWINEENQRIRIVLVSKDGLFKNKNMSYTDRFSYQFNQSGNYTFVLAEFGSLKEYTNATGKVIVK